MQAHGQRPEITDIIGLIFCHVNSEVALRHLAQNPSHIVYGLLQTAADVVGRLRNHADLIRPAVKHLQFMVRREIQIAQTAYGALYSHQLPALAAQNQQRNQNNG